MSLFCILIDGVETPLFSNLIPNLIFLSQCLTTSGLLRQNYAVSRNITIMPCSRATQQKDENWSSPVPVKEVRRFVIDSMVQVGTKRDHAVALADVLVAADYRGHYSHGLNRLGAKQISIAIRTHIYSCIF